MVRMEHLFTKCQVMRAFDHFVMLSGSMLHSYTLSGSLAQIMAVISTNKYMTELTGHPRLTFESQPSRIFEILENDLVYRSFPTLYVASHSNICPLFGKFGLQPIREFFSEYELPSHGKSQRILSLPNYSGQKLKRSILKVVEHSIEGML